LSLPFHMAGERHRDLVGWASWALSSPSPLAPQPPSGLPQCPHPQPTRSPVMVRGTCSARGSGDWGLCSWAVDLGQGQSLGSPFRQMEQKTNKSALVWAVLKVIQNVVPTCTYSPELASAAEKIRTNFWCESVHISRTHARSQYLLFM
jgi:hypothetical protein